MLAVKLAAYIYVGLIAIVILFQFALALGAPWGEMAMGGKYPGKFPANMRVASLVQILLLGVMSLVVLTRAGLLFGNYHAVSMSAIWGVVALSVVSAILNILTPSKKERLVWGPVSLVLLICVILVAAS